ncbi:helix-turn-helix domain-containing protein [Paenibacillus koleovorans]|uniref:helix-turn-helix domain-containing protein n=1 Tax=Paenibacillus koleovorans TaxID=121608 RepID=UPI000FDA999D|nr:helix-turn-helix domain-containing protein [Paenibacillus koleovorans]
MKRNMSFFAAMLLALILVLLFPTLLTIALYQNMQGILKEDVNRSNTAMLKQISMMMDSRLREVEQLAVKVSFRPKIELLLGRSQAMGAPTPYEYKEIMDSLAHYSMANEFIEQQYVYFREQDTVVTPTVKSDASVFYNNFYKYEGLTEQQWRGFLQSSGPEALYLPVMAVTEKNRQDVPERVITYIRPIPYGESGSSQGAFVVLIQEKRIRELLENLTGAHQAKIFIADKTGRLLAESSGDDRLDSLNFDEVMFPGSEQPTVGEASYISRINGEELTVTTVVSPETGWRYVSLVPRATLMETVHGVQSLALTLLGICLLLGIGGAYVLAKRLYSPINQLVDSIVKREEGTDRRRRSEFLLIEETLSHTWRSQEELQTLLDLQAPAIQANFLNRLLRGLVDPKTMNAESLQFVGIRFVSDQFAVIVVDVDDFQKFPGEDDERQWAMVRFVVTNVSQELFGARHHVYVVETDRSRLVLLVNLNTGDSAEHSVQLEAAIENLKVFVDRKFGIAASIGVSNVKHGFPEIRTCLNEAMAAVDYRIVKGKNRVTHYREIDQAQARYYYPLDVELQLTNAIRAGDYEQAEHLLNHVDEMNFKSRQISLEMGRLLYFNMMSTLIQIWNDASDRIRSAFKHDFDPLAELSSCSTLGEMQEKIRDIYRKICEGVESTQQDPGTVLADRIGAYIEERYADNSLSLISIADHFRLTPQYVSGFFKKYKGINLADYLARVRIEHAKRLLHDEALSLNRIAESVGYAKDAGLIRVFKKYVGVTPGKYREHLKNEERS